MIARLSARIAAHLSSAAPSRGPEGRGAAGRANSRSAEGTGAPSLRLVSVMVIATLALLAFAASSASAAPLPSLHLKETFGPSAQPGFAVAEGLAVDQSTGDLYVVDNGALA